MSRHTYYRIVGARDARFDSLPGVPPRLFTTREGALSAMGGTEDYASVVAVEVEIPDPSPPPFRFETVAHVLILHNGSPMMDPTKPGIPSFYMAGYVPVDPARLRRVRVTITEIPDEEGDQ
jgi:hypothetical protein